MPDKTHVYLGVFEFADNPPAVTEVIGLTPTKSWIAGQPRPAHPQTIYHNSGWQLQSPLPITASIEDHLNELLSLLEQHKEGIALAASRFSIGLMCAIYYEDFQPGIHLNESIISRISNLNLSLDLDLYFIGSDTEIHSEQGAAVNP